MVVVDCRNGIDVTIVKFTAAERISAHLFGGFLLFACFAQIYLVASMDTGYDWSGDVDKRILFLILLLGFVRTVSLGARSGWYRQVYGVFPEGIAELHSGIPHTFVSWDELRVVTTCPTIHAKSLIGWSAYVSIVFLYVLLARYPSIQVVGSCGKTIAIPSYATSNWKLEAHPVLNRLAQAGPSGNAISRFLESEKAKSHRAKI